MQISKLNSSKWRHIDVITKNNGKIQCLTITSIKIDADN